ncbi:hypothetical protein EMIT0111MI5_11200 [Burkholderia sp. IT-111MI5]
MRQRCGPRFAAVRVTGGRTLRNIRPRVTAAYGNIATVASVHGTCPSRKTAIPPFKSR